MGSALFNLLQIQASKFQTEVMEPSDTLLQVVIYLVLFLWKASASVYVSWILKTFSHVCFANQQLLNPHIWRMLWGHWLHFRLCFFILVSVNYSHKFSVGKRCISVILCPPLKKRKGSSKGSCYVGVCVCVSVCKKALYFLLVNLCLSFPGQFLVHF